MPQFKIHKRKINIHRKINIKDTWLDSYSMSAPVTEAVFHYIMRS